MVPEASIRAAVLVGAGGSTFANFPTVHSFFERVAWPTSEGLKAACQEIARRISNSEGNDEHLAWPKYDAEKLFGWLELLEKTGVYPRRPAPVADRDT
jgi:hypothetical protein